jgi:hypothetical protein
VSVVYLSGDSSVGIATTLRARRPRDWGSIPGTGKRFCLSPQCPDRLCGTPSLVYNEDWKFFSLSVERLGCEANHSPQSSAELKNGGATPPLSHMSSCHSVSLIKHREIFIQNCLFSSRHRREILTQDAQKCNKYFNTYQRNWIQIFLICYCTTRSVYYCTAKSLFTSPHICMGGSRNLKLTVTGARRSLAKRDKLTYVIICGNRIPFPTPRPSSPHLTAYFFFFIWFVRLLALRPLLAYCASLGW